jgi:hypothetical protein
MSNEDNCDNCAAMREQLEAFKVMYYARTEKEKHGYAEIASMLREMMIRVEAKSR